MSLIGLAENYSVRPSSLLGLENDKYTAYCLDEALAYIKSKIKDGAEPIFEYKTNSFSDFYRHLTGV